MNHSFHMAPPIQGDPGRSGDGSRSNPWRSLEEARDGLRAHRGKNRVPAVIEIAPGVYPTHEPVDYAPMDGATTYRSAGEGVVFEGGVELTGLTEGEVAGRRAWVVDLPEVAHGRRYFRSLYVDGMRRPRARYPKFSPDADGRHKVLQIGELRFPEKRKLFDGDHMFKPKPGDIQDWPSLHDAEVVVLHYWIETRLGNPRLDPKTGWLSCARRSVFNLYESFNPKLARYYIDNLAEALTEPGEWYLDRGTGRFTYLPVEGEVLGKCRLMAPATRSLIRVSGAAYSRGDDPLDPYGTRLVEDLVFEGMTFQNTDWYQPQADLLPHDQIRVEDRPLGSSAQGASNIPGVVEFRWAKGCALRNVTIQHTGFTAVAIEGGCRDCEVSGSRLVDLGAGGVRVGGSELDGPASDRTGAIRVLDNRITDFGKVFQQGIGVLLMHAFGCRVSHNEIARSCYTGISCGWSWSYRETVSRDNVIEENHIHHIGQGVLSDMGGIYTLGVQPGTVIRGNHIHHVESADYGGWGIYPDQASSHMLVEGNWVHDVQGSPFRIHFSRGLVVTGNVFARSKQEGLVGIGRVEGHAAAFLSGNVLLGPALSVFEGGYAGDVRQAFRSEGNLIWFPGASDFMGASHPDHRTDVPKALSLSVWRESGNDRLSIVEDPKVTETANDLVFAADSPVDKTGFKRRSWGGCGPRG